MSLDQVIVHISGQDITLGQIIIIPIVLGLGYLLIRWIARLITNWLVSRSIKADLVHLVRRIFYTLSITILVITTLDLLNVPLTAFAFVSGAVAIGVGFGAQNIINNFISGWILMWEQPIRIGDFLEIDGTFGTVESINTRSTIIRRVDGVHMLVPNSTLLETTVVNWTLIDNLSRTKIRVGVAYGSPVRLVSDLILQATREHEASLSEPAAKVIFEDFADSALIFDVFFWINAVGERDLRVVRSDIRFRITELFETNNIEIAFPQLDIHVDGSLSYPGKKNHVNNHH
ncbi:MAG: small-conductance mechanosensitive channel [Gammaproteobacteria bacterium]|jgi:small-conductance mechanosensitive channel